MTFVIASLLTFLSFFPARVCVSLCSTVILLWNEMGESKIVKKKSFNFFYKTYVPYLYIHIFHTDQLFKPHFQMEKHEIS